MISDVYFSEALEPLLLLVLLGDALQSDPGDDGSGDLCYAKLARILWEVLAVFWVSPFASYERYKRSEREGCIAASWKYNAKYVDRAVGCNQRRRSEIFG